MGQDDTARQDNDSPQENGRPRHPEEPLVSDSRQQRASDQLEDLKRYFGVEFCLVDTGINKVVRHGAAEPPFVWDGWVDVCREVAQQGRADIIDEDDPFVVLAVPLPLFGCDGLVAVAAFVTRSLSERLEIDRAACCLRLDMDSAIAWLAAQRPYDPDLLMGLADLWTEKMVAEQHVTRLERSIERLSSQLGATYEEVSVINQLAQSLEQERVFSGMVHAMTAAIDAKDPYTRGHSDRVARLAVRLGKELACDEATLRTIYLSGLLHDIGKIGVDESVLTKPGKLTELEYEHIKSHVKVGYHILRDHRRMADALPAVLYHHEAWDGSGYPHGLAGEEIPFVARVVAVADAYDAMASNRPYRPGMDDVRLERVLRAGAGRQWDPAIIDACFRAIDDIRRIERAADANVDVDELCRNH